MSHVDADATRTYDVSLDAELPGLTGGTIARVAVPESTEPQTTYFDTSDLALAAAGISLCRRTGGTDDGWLLSLPADGEAPVEVWRALGRGTRVPNALARMLTATTMGLPLVAKVAISTTRTARALVGRDGAVLATVSDDVVTATLPDGTPLRWREVEVELVDGDKLVLDQLDRVLTAVGISRSSWDSKLQRALESVIALPRPPATESASHRKSAGEAVHQYLVAQQDVLTKADLAVRSAACTIGRLHARNEERVPNQLRAYEHAVKRALKRKESRFLRTG